MQVTLTSQRYNGVSANHLCQRWRRARSGSALCTAIFLGLLSLCVAGGRARAEALQGLYLDAEFGRARNTYDTNDLDAQWQSVVSESHETLKFTTRSDQRYADAWLASVGYLFNPYIGLEAGFVHAGELRYVASGTVTAGSAAQSTSLRAEVTSHGPLLALVGRLPLLEALDVDLRVGAYDGRSDFNDVLTLGSHSAPGGGEKSTVCLLGGLGVDVRVLNHLSVRLAYLRINHTGDTASTGHFNVDMAMAGMRWTF
ncbi:MAG TPA: outer membrane beta-barrel protein [Steroidobacteraceae bacterium]|jgi:hypothetical protein